MKQQFVFLSAIAIFIALVFQSCKKDNISLMNSKSDFIKEEMKAYDDFGPKLEAAVDLALVSEAFQYALVKLTQERPMGDFEVLLSSLLEYKVDEVLIRDILIEKAEGLFTNDELEVFLQNYPSLVIATRGDVLSWLKDGLTPSVAFVHSDFKETDKAISGIREGEMTEIRLDQPFENLVIALHISERHDRQGNPIITDHNTYLSSKGNNYDGPEKGGGGDIVGGVTCGSVPLSCTDPFITSFTVENMNGGVRLDYEILGFPPTLCEHGEVTITRTGTSLSNGEVDIVTYTRTANQNNVFFDVSINPNTTYTYEISASIRYALYISAPSEGAPVPREVSTGWGYCNSNTLSDTVTTENILVILDSFKGNNYSSEQIQYNWNPPTGASVNHYRLRVNQNGVYETVAEIPHSGGDYYYTYSHNEEDRGNLVEMQIQYRESGLWGGDFYDKSYASFREPNQPLKYYGLKLANIESYEVSSSGESPIYGAPEIRLKAVRGALNGDDRTAIILQETVVFMESCATTEWITEWSWSEFAWIPVPITIPSDYYVPPYGEAVDILTQWDNNLTGSAVTIKLTETDNSELVITESSTVESIQRGISGEIGVKTPKDAGGLGGSAGIESDHEFAEEKMFLYPTDDIDIDVTTIYYHQLHKQVSINNLYGLLFHPDGTEITNIDCALLEAELD